MFTKNFDIYMNLDGKTISGIFVPYVIECEPFGLKKFECRTTELNRTIKEWLEFCEGREPTEEDTLKAKSFRFVTLHTDYQYNAHINLCCTQADAVPDNCNIVFMQRPWSNIITSFNLVTHINPIEGETGFFTDPNSPIAFYNLIGDICNISLVNATDNFDVTEEIGHNQYQIDVSAVMKQYLPESKGVIFASFNGNNDAKCYNHMLSFAVNMLAANYKNFNKGEN